MISGSELAHLDYRISDHINRIRAVIRSTEDLKTITERVLHSTDLLLRTDVNLTGEQRQAPQSGYNRNLLHQDEENGFVVMAMVWAPEASTPVHDHGTWGIAGVAEGSLRVTDYERIDNGTIAGKAILHEVGISTAGVGDSTRLLSPDDDIHKVENASDGVTISIHTYGMKIDACNIFDLEKNTIKWTELETN